MTAKLTLVAISVLLTCILLPRRAAADAIELSMGFSFNRSNYTETNYSWSRRWGSSAAYHFTERSSLEFSFQDIVDRTLIVGYEDTTFHDQVYSVNWIQALTGKNFPVQPYFKLGVGQLNRSASGTYAGGAQPSSSVDSVTGVIGGGMRIYLTRTFALRTEATTYLTGGSLRTWKDNFGFNFGVSFIF